MSSIVIYEEDDLMRELLEEWLSNAGYGVHGVASNGHGAASNGHGVASQGTPANWCAGGWPACAWSPWRAATTPTKVIRFSK